MDSGGVPERPGSLEEDDSSRHVVQQTTTLGGLGMPPVLWHDLRGEEHSFKETLGQGAFWSGSSVKKGQFFSEHSSRILWTSSRVKCNETKF